MKHTLLTSLLLILCSPTAFAQDTRDSDVGAARIFGEEGQLAISSDASMEIRRSTGDVTAIGLSPAADFFLVENLSLGGALIFEYDQTGDTSTTRFGIGPRVGYNVPFNENFGIWPKLGFSYSHRNITTETVNVGSTTVSASSTSNAFALNLFAPILFHPVPHFFAGLGPFLDTDLSGDNKVTTFGAKLAIGGWFTP